MRVHLNSPINGWPIDYSFSKSYHIERALICAGIQLENFMKK